jgi:hypothetical protein
MPGAHYGKGGGYMGKPKKKAASRPANGTRSTTRTTRSTRRR